MVSTLGSRFVYEPLGKFFYQNLKLAFLQDYDVVWLRLPPPLDTHFLKFLKIDFGGQLFINDPLGIALTGSKKFLLQCPKWCPPMKLCRSAEDILAFSADFPIVLKPLQDYGAKGDRQN